MKQRVNRLDLDNINLALDVNEKALRTEIATKTAPQPTNVNITDSAFSLNGAKLQMFAFEITNTAGTLQHRIIGDTTTPTASPLVDKISGASAAYANTPNVSSVVDFVSGAGIDNTGTHRFTFNTAAQTDSKFMAFGAVLERDSTATAGLTGSCRNLSLNVNGTTLNRFTVSVLDSAGNVFALTTANIAAGAVIRFRVAAFID